LSDDQEQLDDSIDLDYNYEEGGHEGMVRRLRDGFAPLLVSGVTQGQLLGLLLPYLPAKHGSNNAKVLRDFITARLVDPLAQAGNLYYWFIDDDDAGPPNAAVVLDLPAWPWETVWEPMWQEAQKRSKELRDCMARGHVTYLAKIAAMIEPVDGLVTVYLGNEFPAITDRTIQVTAVCRPVTRRAVHDDGSPAKSPLVLSGCYHILDDIEASAVLPTDELYVRVWQSDLEQFGNKDYTVPAVSTKRFHELGQASTK
jgi:hypothetical protein